MSFDKGGPNQRRGAPDETLCPGGGSEGGHAFIGSLPAPEAPETSTMSLRAFRRNVIWNAAFLVAQVIGLLWLTRFLVLSLGTTEFSLVPLSNSVVNYLTVFTVALSAGAARELTRAFAAGEPTATDRVFRTAAWGGIGLAGLLAPVGVLAAFVVSRAIRLPAELRPDAFVLLVATLLGFLLAVASTAFGATLFARNRLDLRSSLNIIQLAVRLACVALFVELGAGLAGVALGTALAAVVGFGLMSLASRRVAPGVRMRPVGVDLPLFRHMAGLGAWVSLDQVGTLLIFSTDVLLVNLLFGPAAAGVYGAIAVVCTAMRAGTSVVANALAPPVVDAYARHDSHAVIHYASASTRVLGVVLALPAGIACGLSADVLAVWLGSEWRGEWPVLVVLVAPLPLTLSTSTLFSVQLAAGRVRVPGLVSLGSGLVMVVAAFLLGSVAPSLGALTVALAMAMALLLRNVAVLPTYTARVMNAPTLGFLSAALPGAVGTVVAGLLSFGLGMAVGPEGFLQLFLAAVAVAAVYAPVAWLGLVGTRERSYLRQLLGRGP